MSKKEVNPADLRRWIDQAACARTFSDLTTCVGGRVVVEGWSCVHCGSVETDEECFMPVAKDGDGFETIDVKELFQKEKEHEGR